MWVSQQRQWTVLIAHHQVAKVDVGRLIQLPQSRPSRLTCLTSHLCNYYDPFTVFMDLQPRRAIETPSAAQLSPVSSSCSSRVDVPWQSFLYDNQLQQLIEYYCDLAINNAKWPTGPLPLWLISHQYYCQVVHLLPIPACLSVSISCGNLAITTRTLYYVHSLGDFQKWRNNRLIAF